MSCVGDDWSFVAELVVQLFEVVARRLNNGVWSSLSICETSYEGHMVDALASRADEGRSSLR
jgi:hypothetical protein